MTADEMNAKMASATIANGFGSNNIITGQINPNQIFRAAQTDPYPDPSVIFSANLRVRKVANGYTVEISRVAGYTSDVFIAETVEDVRTVIMAQMAVAQLEK